MGKIDKSAVSGRILCTTHKCKSAAFCGVAIRAVLKWQVLAGFLGARSIICRCPPLSPAGAARRDRTAAGLIAAFSWQKQKQTRGLVATSTRVVFRLQQQAATLASSYIEQREAFAFLVPKTMIGRRRRWRQQEREKVVRNVFEAQMHARMRRQSLKHVELRRPEALEADCVTLDLGSARSSDTSLGQDRAARRVARRNDKADQRQWVPHSIEELEASSSSSSSSSDDIGNIFSPGREEEGDELVLKVRQPLSQDAWFRLEKLGGLDMALAVPAFVYRVFLGEEKDFSGDATEGSRGVYRLPRLLHNSRVNLPPRSVDCYL